MSEEKQSASERVFAQMELSPKARHGAEYLHAELSREARAEVKRDEPEHREKYGDASWGWYKLGKSDMARHLGLKIDGKHDDE